jgi:hypothetical protein
MAILGSLRTMGIADIMQWLAHSRKTGTLLLSYRSIRKQLVVQNGRLTSTWSNDPRESLGQYLIRERLITEESLFKALLQQEQIGMPLGGILVEMNHLSEDELRRTLKLKAEESIYDLFMWRDGEFEFREETITEGPILHVDIEVNHVLLEGARRVDELTRIQKVIPSTRATFQVLVPADVHDKAMETKALLLAARGKCLAEIALELRASNFDTAVLLHELLLGGRLRVEEAGDEDTGPVDAVERIAERLAAAQQRLAEKRYDAALEAYEAALALDRLNQHAKKGLVAVAEARERDRAARRISLDRIPRIVADLKTLARQQIDPQEGFVLSRVNGRWNVRSILKVCPMGEEEALLIFARLIDRRLIELI